MLRSSTAFAFLLTVAHVQGDDGFRLNLLTDPSAVCLDGSPGGFYLREGVGASASTWLIEMEGGGWCVSAADCQARAKTDIGSSKNWPATGCPGMDGGSNGMLSNDCSTSPFCNATAVHLNYCDGASFASSRGYDEASGLQFSGAFIFNATFERLLSLGLGSATEVILKGCSAGGLAVYLHCDLFADMLAATGSKARVVCMPDAGFFRMNYDTFAGKAVYTPEQQWVYSYQNVTQMDAGCVAARTSNETWQCFFAEENLPFISTPLFVTQDLVDSWQMGNILDIPCNLNAASGPSACNSTEISAVHDYRASMLAALAPLTSSPTNGGYLSACYQHCHQNIEQVWDQELVQNTTVEAAFMSWWTNTGTTPRIVVDGEFGKNPHCYGTPYCRKV